MNHNHASGFPGQFWGCVRPAYGKGQGRLPPEVLLAENVGRRSFSSCGNRFVCGPRGGPCERQFAIALWLWVGRGLEGGEWGMLRAVQKPSHGPDGGKGGGME